MKDIFAWIGRLLGLVFGALVIGYTAWLTFLLSGRLVPGNVFLQVMTVVLFDVGALVWFTLFLTVARGTAQWAIAGLGFLIGLIGAIIMAGGELIMGQELVTVENLDQIGWILVATVIIAALTHASLTYSFHFLDPHVKNRIENAQQVSKVIEKGYEAGRAEIERRAEELGGQIANSLVYEAEAQLRAAVLPFLRSASKIDQQIADEQQRIQAGNPGQVIIPGELVPANNGYKRAPTPPKNGGQSPK